jgi:hypothetical protein
VFTWFLTISTLQVYHHPMQLNSTSKKKLCMTRFSEKAISNFKFDMSLCGAHQPPKVHQESTRSPPGVHVESTWSPCGVHQESMWSLSGVYGDLWGSVKYRPLCIHLVLLPMPLHSDPQMVNNHHKSVLSASELSGCRDDCVDCH